MIKKNLANRINHEKLLRKLHLECNKTELNGSLDYLTDYVLLCSINGFLKRLGLVVYTDRELLKQL